MQNHVYHWKHGWIPLTHYAALVKAHGSHKGAAKYLNESNDNHGTESHKLGDHVVLYHGTTRANAELIRQNGIPTKHSAGWFTVTESKEQAEHYANHDGAVVEFHVPRSAIYTRGGSKDAVLWQGVQHATGGVTATAHAVRTHLPASMVHTVHDIKPKPH
jgi:hypothetical protein